MHNLSTLWSQVQTTVLTEQAQKRNRRNILEATSRQSKTDMDSTMRMYSVVMNPD